MGNTQTKEEVVIAQTAGVGSNTARTQQQQETTNTILVVICTILAIGLVIILYKLYNRCHKKQIQRHIDDATLKRYSSILRRQQACMGAVPQASKAEVLNI
ncbi:hypothetical protein PYW08_010209 [Mythimna loreyi]|uniref:Uncharacterized protein n=1 Tax=Mythimna loreyi TaxID=667449 RepID=A0ACC2Q5T9_9NEOP|nr:hypothetical protein PYW08_010209 [Mythimna loreyi]